MAYDRIRDWRTPVFFVLAVLCVCLVSYFAGRVKGRRIGWEKGWAAGYEAGYAAVHPSDTLVRVDTLLVDRPVPVYTTIEKPVYFPLVDTMLVTIHDTTFVALNRTRKGYSGEDYEAQVSGVDPALDWVRVFPKTITITEWSEPPQPGRWSIGVAVGPGVFWNHADGVRPGVGAVLGVQFRF